MSSVLRGVCNALVGGVGAILVMAALAIAFGRMDRINYFGQSLDLASLGGGVRLALQLFVFVLGALALKALHHLRRLLSHYTRGEVFSANAARQIRQFGFCCVCWGVAKVAWVLVPLLLPSPPSRLTGFSFDTLVIGLVIVVISWLSEMAAELREENELTV